MIAALLLAAAVLFGGSAPQSRRRFRAFAPSHAIRPRRSLSRAAMIRIFAAVVGLSIAVWMESTLGFLLGGLGAGHRRDARLAFGAAQHGAHPFQQQALGEGLADIIVGTGIQAHQLVDLFVLAGEEDHRQIGIGLAQAAQQLQPVHARHLDVQDGEVGRGGGQSGERGGAVRKGADVIAFLLQQHADGREDILVVIDEGDIGHETVQKYEVGRV